MSVFQNSDKGLIKLLKICSDLKDYEHSRSQTIGPAIFSNELLFEKLITQNLFSDEDFKELLDSIKFKNEIENLCQNSTLLKHLYKRCLLNEKHIDNFTSGLKYSIAAFYVQELNFFSYINFRSLYCLENDDLVAEPTKKSAKNIDQELLNLNDLYSCLYKSKFTIEERKLLIELCKANQCIMDSLKYLIENQLEDTFENFEELMKYLKKSTKKTLLNV